MSNLVKNYNRKKFFFQKEREVIYILQMEKYLDFMSRYSINLLGHSNPYLNKGIEKSSSKIWHVSNAFIIPEGEKLVKKLYQKHLPIM